MIIWYRDVPIQVIVNLLLWAQRQYQSSLLIAASENIPFPPIWTLPGFSFSVKSSMPREVQNDLALMKLAFMCMEIRFVRYVTCVIWCAIFKIRKKFLKIILDSQIWNPTIFPNTLKPYVADHPACTRILENQVDNLKMFHLVWIKFHSILSGLN